MKNLQTLNQSFINPQSQSVWSSSQINSTLWHLDYCLLSVNYYWRTLTSVSVRKPWAVTYLLLSQFEKWKVAGAVFLCSLVLISITLFITFFSLPVPRLISLIVVYWAKYFHRWSPWARAQPHCPRSNYSTEERTVLLVCEGTFPWMPSSPGVQSSSAQLLLHSDAARERKRPLLRSGESQRITSTEFLTYFKHKNPTTYFHSYLQYMTEYVATNIPLEFGRETPVQRLFSNLLPYNTWQKHLKRTIKTSMQKCLNNLMICSVFLLWLVFYFLCFCSLF